MAIKGNRPMMSTLCRGHTLILKDATGMTRETVVTKIELFPKQLSPLDPLRGSLSLIFSPSFRREYESDLQYVFSFPVRLLFLWSIGRRSCEVCGRFLVSRCCTQCCRTGLNDYPVLVASGLHS